MTETPLIKVLYLDDEEQNLQSFRANIRRNFKIFITTNPDEAEALIAEEDIGVVIADHKMPVKTGVQFFEEIRPKFPDSVRILLTAYTDISAAISAINKGEVFRFIDKPWDSDFVVRAIYDAFEIFNTRRQLRIKNAALEKANKELDHFVYSASHDLRAPLMSILGLVNLSHQEEKSEMIDYYLNLIQEAVVKLDSFVINIIDYYRNSRSDNVIKAINFQEVTEDILSSLRYLPGFQDIRFDIQMHQQGTFISDIVKWRIILTNLISNAIKFKDPSKATNIIRISGRITQERCEIEVDDNGLGIPEKELDKIFQMFYKGRGMSSGSGVGLYIVEEAVSKLNGTIQVSSQVAIGTTFQIHAPCISITPS